MTPGTDERRGTTVSTRLRWAVIGLVVLFCAYVVGRAAGILLGVGPYPGEAVALLVVLAGMIRTAVRRGR